MQHRFTYPIVSPLRTAGATAHGARLPDLGGPVVGAPRSDAGAVGFGPARAAGLGYAGAAGAGPAGATGLTQSGAASDPSATSTWGSPVSAASPALAQAW